MQPTGRAAGVTASAIVTFLGSGFTLLLALGTCLPLMLRPTDFPAESATPSPINIRTTLMLCVVFYLALAGWGFVTGGGLLRLRAWARTSILIFSGLALFFSLCGGLGGYIAMRLMPASPGGPSPAAVAGIMLAIMAVPGAIAIWWLIYFNLRSVRELFGGHRTSEQYTPEDGSTETPYSGPRRPISITVIAWMNLLGTPTMAWLLWKGYPAYLFGAMFEGLTAKAIYVTYMLIGLYVGIGLLNLWPHARLAAIWLGVIGVMSGISFELLPGRDERLLRILARTPVVAPHPFSPEQMLPFTRVSMASGWLVALVIVWILIRQKRTFAAGANRQAS